MVTWSTDAFLHRWFLCKYTLEFFPPSSRNLEWGQIIMGRHIIVCGSHNPCLLPIFQILPRFHFPSFPYALNKRTRLSILGNYPINFITATCKFSLQNNSNSAIIIFLSTMPSSYLQFNYSCFETLYSSLYTIKTVLFTMKFYFFDW